MPKKHATYDGHKRLGKENLPGLAYLRGLARAVPYGRGLENRTGRPDRAGLLVR